MRVATHLLNDRRAFPSDVAQAGPVARLVLARNEAKVSTDGFGVGNRSLRGHGRGPERIEPLMQIVS